MLRAFLIIFVICAFLSCKENNNNINLQKELKNDSSAKTGTIVFGEPLIIHSSHNIIYPLILEKTDYGSGFSSGSGEQLVSGI